MYSRLPRGVLNNMLCQYCKSVVDNMLQNPKPYERSEHQPGYSSLSISALNGCELCSLFKEAMLSEYRRRVQCSATEAEAYFRNTKSKCTFYLPWTSLDARYAPYKVGVAGVNFSCLVSSDYEHKAYLGIEVSDSNYPSVAVG